MTTTASSSDFAQGAEIDVDRRLRLSRFLSIRPAEDGFVLEQPLVGNSRRIKGGAAFEILFHFIRPTTPRAILDAVITAEKRGVVASLLGVCIANGWLVEVDDQGRASEDGDEFAPWEFHDLLFHVHSRRGRNPHPVGATYPWRGRLEAEPAFVDDVCERPIPLLRPAVGEPLAPIDQLLASRRTRYSTAPVPLDALGRLLYFSCRVISVAKSGDELLIKKPYPSPGSLHPLDTYVIVARCPELDRGLYRYEAREHALIPIGGPSAEIDDLLNEARRGTGCLDEEPSILLVFSARFRRLSWKYQSIAYHLLLQEVGGLYQTLYLVAEALGLAACALGAGDSDNFARAAGTNYYRATSVGEFLLGGRT